MPTSKLLTTGVVLRARGPKHGFASLARAVLQAALMREESRSEHVREDFPVKDNDGWQKRIAVRLDQENNCYFGQ